MLVYIHVPFCKTKCNYCAFHSEPIFEKNKGDTPVYDATSGEEAENNFDHPLAKFAYRKQVWLDTLMEEIEVRSKELGKRRVRTIFFGGGTPSLLEDEIIYTIIKKIQKHFKVDPKAEITLEANPESLNSKQKVQSFLKTGINRLSIGVQAFDDTLLKMLGRAHNYGAGLNAITYARSGGCSNINVDMMWGLPTQKVSQWIWQITELTKQKPDHISMYGLTIEEGTNFGLLAEKDELELPKENDLSLMYMRGAEILQDNGMLQYEISNFSRMGFQCQHNLGYWEGRDYLGLGPSATSTLGNIRRTNPYDLELYKKHVQDPSLEIDTEILTLQDRVMELIMLRLRTTRGLRVKAFSDLTGRDFLKDNKSLIHALHQKGLLRILNGYIRLTRNGFLVSNAILSHLFENTKKCLALGEDKDFVERRAKQLTEK